MSPPEVGTEIGGHGGGALPDSAAVVGQVAASAQRYAATAASLAGRLGDDAHTLLATLGGGPPAQLAEADAHASTAVAALNEASSALREAVVALRTFGGRLS